MRLFLSKFTFPEAFMRYFNNFDAFMKLVLSMKDGFGNTLMIFFFTLLFSLPLGLAVALLRMSRRISSACRRRCTSLSCAVRR